MRKVLSAIIAIFIFMTVFSGIPTSAAADSERYTTVSSGSAFNSQIVGKSNAKVRLTRDITISSPIGWLGDNKELVVDGAGHTITLKSNVPFIFAGGVGKMTFKNFTILTEAETHTVVPNEGNYGLLIQHGAGGSLVLENVKGIANIRISGGKTGGGIGGLVGKTDATGGNSFKGCSFEGSIEAADVKPGHYRDGIGGIAGCVVDAEFINCSVNADISAQVTPEGDKNKYSAGGIVGNTPKGVKIIKCSSSGSIVLNMTQETAYAGGIVGLVNPYSDANELSSVYITDSKSSMTVNAKGADGANAGGIVGCISRERSVILGNLTSSSAVEATATSVKRNAAGGIVGAIRDIGGTADAEYLFDCCVNTGKLTGEQAGGVLGAAIDVFGAREIKFTTCANSGEICGVKYAGGIIGANIASGAYADYIIESCGNGGRVSADRAGGIISALGAGNATLSGLANCGDIVGSSAAGGIAASIDQSITLSGCINAKAVSGGNEFAGGASLKASECITSTAQNALEKAKAVINGASAAVAAAPDYTHLDELIARCAELQEADYTWVRWNKLQAALTAAKDIRLLECAYGIDKAATELSHRLETLTKLPTLEEYDAQPDGATEAPDGDEPQDTPDEGNRKSCYATLGASAAIVFATVCGVCIVAVKKKED